MTNIEFEVALCAAQICVGGKAEDVPIEGDRLLDILTTDSDRLSFSVLSPISHSLLMKADISRIVFFLDVPALFVTDEV